MINDLYDLQQNLSQAGVLSCYCGPITQEFIEATGKTIRQKTSPAMAMRVFSVFVEMVQNISFYSHPEHKIEASDPERSGIILVGRNNENFFIYSGNQIYRTSSTRIEDLLKCLQKMDKNELKAFYKKKRRQDPDPESKGAGLGFIEIARKSTDFSYSIRPVDEERAFFSLKVCL